MDPEFVYQLRLQVIRFLAPFLVQALNPLSPTDSITICSDFITFGLPKNWKEPLGYYVSVGWLFGAPDGFEPSKKPNMEANFK